MTNVSAFLPGIWFDVEPGGLGKLEPPWGVAESLKTGYNIAYYRDWSMGYGEKGDRRIF